MVKKNESSEVTMILGTKPKADLAWLVSVQSKGFNGYRRRRPKSRKDFLDPYKTILDQRHF